MTRGDFLKSFDFLLLETDQAKVKNGRRFCLIMNQSKLAKKCVFLLSFNTPNHYHVKCIFFLTKKGPMVYLTPHSSIAGT